LRESWEPGSYRKPALETDGQLVEDLWPVGNRSWPFLDDIDIGQIQHLADCLSAGERRLVFSDFAELAVVAFDGVGGVNQAPDFGRIVEEGD
jgi:hypothetical protein